MGRDLLGTVAQQHIRDSPNFPLQTSGNEAAKFGNESWRDSPPGAVPGALSLMVGLIASEPHLNC